MNILVFISSLLFGGAEKQAITDANLLSQKNRVFLLTFKNGSLGGQLNKNVKLIILRKRGYIRTTLKLLALINDNNISIIHAHLFAPMILSAMVGILIKVPVIWNFHSHAYGDSIKTKIAYKLLSGLPVVKRIIFPAKELEKYYISEGYCFNLEKTQIIYNSGQDINKLSKPYDQKKASIVQIGYVGRIIPLKRIHLLIDLAVFLLQQELKNFHIHIIGDGSELNSTIDYARKNSVQDHLTFHGFKDDTTHFYNQFDIYAHPSKEEVLSLSLIDAGMHGVPSVAYDIGGNSEIITSNHSGFLVVTNEEFFSKVYQLAQNSVLRNAMGMNAQIECETKFSPEVRLLSIQKIYEESI